MHTLKGYVLVILSGLALLAAVVFLIVQWGAWSTLPAFGPDTRVRTVYVMLASAAGGVVLWWVCRLMVRGLIIVRHARRERRSRAAADAPRAERDADHQDA